MIGRIRRAARFWVEVTSERESPIVLAVFRIALGAVLLGSLASAFTSGVLESMWIDVEHGGALHLRPNSFWIDFLGGASPQVVFGVAGVAAVSGILVLLGLGGFVPYLLAGQAYGALVKINGETSGSYDSMITNALYLLMFSAANATLSLDCRRKSGAFTSGAVAPAWPRYLLIFQLLVIYGATGLQKLSPTWTPLGGYSALYWVFQDPTWRRFDMDFTASLSPLLALATAATWHFEIGAPLLLLYYYAKRTAEAGGTLRRWLLIWDLRKAFAIIGLGLHVGILLTLNVGPFSFVSLAYYLTLLRPAELEHAWRRRYSRRMLSTSTPN
jgi:hypothetical protein